MGIKRRVILSKDKDILDLHAQCLNRYRLKYYVLSLLLYYMLNYLADQINFWSVFFLAQNLLKPVSSVASSHPSEVTRFLKPVLDVALSQ